MKLYPYLLASLCGLSFTCIEAIHTVPESRFESVEEEMDFFEELIAIDDDPFTDAFFLQQSHPTRVCPAETTFLELLVNTVQLPELLKQNLFCHTNTINIRPLLDLPSLQPLFDCHSTWLSFSVQAFFNQMRKCYFTKRSSALGSYIRTDRDLLETLDTTLFEGDAEFDIPAILGPFSPIKLEERRLGFLLSAYTRYNCWGITLKLPVYWLEHNFFLTEEEQEAIGAIDVFNGAAVGSDRDDYEAFFMKHLVTTKIGCGDLRINADYFLIDECAKNWRVGLQFTAPTGKPICSCGLEEALGDVLLFGGTFCKYAPQPPIDSYGIFCRAFDGTTLNKEIAAAELFDIGLGFLDRLTTILADQPMGQRHISFGPTLNARFPITDCLNMEVFAEFDYWVPRQETRFFLVAKDPSIFNRNWGFTDPAQAQKDVLFLDNQMQNFLFPVPLYINVKPGIVTKFALGFAYDSYHVHAAFGYDFWHQGQERLTGCFPRYDIARGIKPAAYQSKLYGRVFGHRHCQEYLFRLGLRGDITVDSYGIGKDVTITADLVFDF